MPDESQGNTLPEGYRPPESRPYFEYVSPVQFPGPVPPPGPYTAGSPSPTPNLSPTPSPAPLVSRNFPGQKKRRPGCWITIGILIVLLASVASFLAIRYINRPTPDKTLDTFCSALQQADYRTAYNQFSTKLQRTISEAVFAGTLSQDKVTACTHGTTTSSGSSVTNSLKLVHASKGINNDIVTLAKDNNNDWKIDDMYKQG